MDTDKEITDLAERFCRLARAHISKHPEHRVGMPSDWQVHADLAAMHARQPLPFQALRRLDDSVFLGLLSAMAFAAEQAGYLDDAGGLQ